MHIPGNWNSIPEHCREGLRSYIGWGTSPGGFLTSLLSNDLCGAVSKADTINRSRLMDYVAFLYGDAPSQCWGSPEKVEAWIERGGLAGRIVPFVSAGDVATGIVDRLVKERGAAE